jgi:hypothetical protein
MPKGLAWTQQHNGLNVTITSKVVVYASADRAEKLPLFSPPSFSPLWCGLWKRQRYAYFVLLVLFANWWDFWFEERTDAYL